MLPSSVVSGMKSYFLQEKVPIAERPGLRMTSAIVQYIANIRNKNAGMSNITNVKCKSSDVSEDAEDRAENSKSTSLDAI